MKQRPEFVSGGRIRREEGAEAPEPEEDVYAPEPTAAWPAADLPRDYGLTADGRRAYEVPTLEAAVRGRMADFARQLGSSREDRLREILLGVLKGRREGMPEVRAFENNVAVLAVKRASERFAVSRFVVPALRRALETEFGPVRIEVVVQSR